MRAHARTPARTLTPLRSAGSRRLSQVLTGSRDNTLGLLDGCSLVADTPPRKFTAEGFRLPYLWSRARFSPDSGLITAGSGDGSVFVWQQHGNKLVATLKEHRCCAGGTGALVRPAFPPLPIAGFLPRTHVSFVCLFVCCVTVC
jgi:hypothetical protein